MKELNMSEKNAENQFLISIKNENEYQYFLKELEEWFANGELTSTLGDYELERLKSIVRSLEAFDSKTLFIIHYTNNTCEIKSFANYDEALNASYSDHLLQIAKVNIKL